METFKVIVAGSRDFNDYDLLVKKLDFLLQNKKDIEIVSGNARGADALGERYAKERGYALKLFPADWKTFGVQAGYFRNLEMAKYANALAAFWDSKSPGTRMMIVLAIQNGLLVSITAPENPFDPQKKEKGHP